MAGKPKPTRMKILEGNPGRRKLHPEPDMSSDMPDPPEPVKNDAYALEEWRRLAPGLHVLGLLNAADATTFGAYCTAYSRWRNAEELLQEIVSTKGRLAALIQVTKAGNYIQNTLVGVANKAMGDMMKYAGEFGLTPVARARLAVDPAVAGKNKFEGLIGGGIK